MVQDCPTEWTKAQWMVRMTGRTVLKITHLIWTNTSVSIPRVPRLCLCTPQSGRCTDCGVDGLSVVHHSLVLSRCISKLVLVTVLQLVLNQACPIAALRALSLMRSLCVGGTSWKEKEDSSTISLPIPTLAVGHENWAKHSTMKSKSHKTSFYSTVLGVHMCSDEIQYSEGNFLFQTGCGSSADGALPKREKCKDNFWKGCIWCAMENIGSAEPKKHQRKKPGCKNLGRKQSYWIPLGQTVDYWKSSSAGSSQPGLNCEVKKPNFWPESTEQCLKDELNKLFPFLFEGMSSNGYWSFLLFRQSRKLIAHQ